MQISIHPWYELDLHEIARLTHAAREAGRQADEEAIARVEQQLVRQFTDLPRFAVLARSGEQLVGWVMLVVHNPTKIEVNPWHLGGHPLVAPGQDWWAVGALLLQEAIAWARRGGFEAVELCVDQDLGADPSIYESYGAWYGGLGFHVREDSRGFFYRPCSLGLSGLATPEGIELRPVADVDQDELYRCYYDTLAASQAGLFLDQSEAERRAYFDMLGKTYGQHRETSLALILEGRIVGFCYTIPFGEHLHLDWIGIHPDLRRRGLGRFLLRLIMERAGRAGFRTMGLSCDVGNAPAIALYRSLGWQDGGDAEITYAANLSTLRPPHPML
jgi:ribosomal-protein-alanine N-acetyltransferase